MGEFVADLLGAVAGSLARIPIQDAQPAEISALSYTSLKSHVCTKEPQ